MRCGGSVCCGAGPGAAGRFRAAACARRLRRQALGGRRQRRHHADGLPEHHEVPAVAAVHRADHGRGPAAAACLERRQGAAWLVPLAVYGAAPMFFYVLHLYVLKFLYLGGEAVWGLNQGKFFGFSAMWMVWLASVVLAFALYPAVRAFAALKARRRDIAWLKYL
ncbi:hypothetical protein DdX_21833 [Ditylenchus destructor]|uniref:Uncharacterized protein n=1 Tax=Ditylenchus destructor TaxID=166010 RepID=A0AAD4QVB9_9BILA|nr:hypothetical protein DdX_21833 [Ditylenchus destructor]